MRWGTRAIELAKKLGAADTLAHALNNVGTAELFAYNDDGLTKLEESLRIALAHDLHEDVGRAYTNLAFLTVKNRRYDLANRYLEDGIAYAAKQDLFYGLYMIASRARLHFDRGEWDHAADDAGSDTLDRVVGVPRVLVSPRDPFREIRRLVGTLRVGLTNDCDHT